MQVKLLAEMEKEYREWQRIIEDFSQQNALLKYRLSEVVDSNEDKNLLQVAEYFQNELLLRDEVLKRLRSELQEYAETRQPSQVLTQKVITKHKSLRNDFLNFEKKFTNLSEEFNTKMTESHKH